MSLSSNKYNATEYKLSLYLLPLNTYNRIDQDLGSSNITRFIDYHSHPSIRWPIPSHLPKIGSNSVVRLCIFFSFVSFCFCFFCSEDFSGLGFGSITPSTCYHLLLWNGSIVVSLRLTTLRDESIGLISSPLGRNQRWNHFRFPSFRYVGATTS